MKFRKKRKQKAMIQAQTSNGDWYDPTLPVEVILNELSSEERLRPTPGSTPPTPAEDNPQP